MKEIEEVNRKGKDYFKISIEKGNFDNKVKNSPYQDKFIIKVKCKL